MTSIEDNNNIVWSVTVHCAAARHSLGITQGILVSRFLADELGVAEERESLSDVSDRQIKTDCMYVKEP